MFAAAAALLWVQEEAAIEGSWNGTLKVGGGELRLVVSIRKAEGRLTGTMDSLDQGTFGIPLDEVTLDKLAFAFRIKAIGGKFEGTLAGGEIRGRWTQSGADLPLVLQKGALEPPRRPQVPRKPYPYSEEEVEFQNKSGAKLAGTLTLPAGAGRRPAALLLAGSGPLDRDEALMGHRPFLVLADHLTRRGIAVLRFDKRGVAKSGGTFAGATTEDFVDDSLSGLAYLKGRKEVDPGRIGLVGHSEGGWVAPMAATRSADVAWIVLLAGPAIPGEEILLQQAALVSRAQGADEAAVEANAAIQKQIFDVVKREPDPAVRRKKIREVAERALGDLPDGRGGPLAVALEGQVKMAADPWFRYFLQFDPRGVLEKVRCPVLALFGQFDLQVPAKTNVPAMKEALKAAGIADASVLELPGLNHLFQTSRTGSPAEYARIEETFSASALDAVGAWIERRFGGR